ncbi:hypothetical protein CWI38_0303p0030 [Hamiltosporidium tvaerminnensis]|uniref:Uncharacterized protein n=1 Tax=Hamiltosporidium tvaerminnensis TaxID=1176355 RepID=A0A4Q9LYQ2_9MICR|nr:hypothetical protein CWI38_0519p0020 [Hamiltosporidium tvaerminnensis]TBU15970.1 hypothetical protein CWI38_0303p0030 [Hamiltosporidium tvaerminnensis]
MKFLYSLRIILLLNGINLILTAISDSIQVGDQDIILDESLLREIVLDKEEYQRNHSYYNSKKREDEFNNKKGCNTAVRLGCLFRMSTDLSKRHNNDLETNSTASGSIQSKTVSLFVIPYGEQISDHNQYAFEVSQAYLFNPLENPQNEFAYYASDRYPQFIIHYLLPPPSNDYYLGDPGIYFPSYECNKSFTATDMLNLILNRLYFTSNFMNLEDLLPLLQYDYLFTAIANKDTYVEHLITLENISYNEITIKYTTNITEKELEEYWKHFDRKYSSIKIIDYDSPLISYFPGIVHLKEFIYNLLKSLPLRRRNIFSVFVGMKMIESLLVSSKEIISSIIKDYVHDMFSFDSDLKKTLNFHKKILFKIMKVLLSKNFDLSEEFFISLRIVETRCIYLSKDTLYINGKYNSYFLRALIDSIFLLDEQLNKNVFGFFANYIKSVNLKTGFVDHNFIDFAAIYKTELDPEIVLKLIKYYLEMLRKNEFMGCRDIDVFMFNSVIISLTDDAGTLEEILRRKCLGETKMHIDLLLKCINIFNFIIKFGFNRNIHNILYLKSMSEVII